MWQAKNCTVALGQILFLIEDALLSFQLTMPNITSTDCGNHVALLIAGGAIILYTEKIFQASALHYRNLRSVQNPLCTAEHLYCTASMSRMGISFKRETE